MTGCWNGKVAGYLLNILIFMLFILIFNIIFVKRTNAVSTKRYCRLSIIHTRRDSDSAFSDSFRRIKNLTLSEYRKTMRLKKNELSPLRGFYTIDP